MICTLYYVRGGKQELEEVASVQELRKMVSFTFTNGSTVNVMRQHLLHYELHEQEAAEKKADAQDVLNRFDDFVNSFIYKVEHSVRTQSRYSIPVTEIDRFKKLLHSRRTTRMTETASLQSLKW